jgi:ribosome maturation factor RimP
METSVSVVCSLVKPELEEVGCDLVDLEVKRVSVTTFVRVYTDKAGRVTLKEITEATKAIRDRFDQENMFDGNYELEVSSPGPARSLRGEGELGKFPGKLVKLYLKDGSSRSGKLARVDSESVMLETEAGNMEEIERGTISDMHLLFSCK